MAKPKAPMTETAAGRIQAAEAKQNGGGVAKGGFAARAQAAGAKNGQGGKAGGGGGKSGKKG